MSTSWATLFAARGRALAVVLQGRADETLTCELQRVRSELEKLMTYMGAEKKIGTDDVQAACGDAGAQSLDTLVYAAAGAKPAGRSRSGP